MKTFQFNHNDYVTVVLTKAGAEHINAKRKAFYDEYPQLKRRENYPNYKEGEVFRTQFWALVNDFHEMLTMGSMAPFEMGEIQVESSYSPTEL